MHAYIKNKVADLIYNEGLRALEDMTEVTYQAIAVDWFLNCDEDSEQDKLDAILYSPMGLVGAAKIYLDNYDMRRLGDQLYLNVTNFCRPVIVNAFEEVLETAYDERGRDYED